MSHWACFHRKTVQILSGINSVQWLKSFCLKPIDKITQGKLYKQQTVYYNHKLRWLSVQEFPDMVEAEFYLGQIVQSICVCSVETKAAF